jgi:hypothetical protein
MGIAQKKLLVIKVEEIVFSYSEIYKMLN